MREQFLEQMKMVLDFDSADFFLADSQESRHLVRPVTYNCDDESPMYDEMNADRGIVYSGKSLVYRETDMISDEKRVQTEYYQKVYRPNNWHYAI